MSEWFLFDEKRNEPVGPYDSDHVIGLLKKKILTWDDYIWSPDFSVRKWKRIHECSELTESMKKYPTCLPPKQYRSTASQSVLLSDLNLSGGGDYGIENIYRRFPRAPLDVEILIHNNKNIFSGRSIDISEKGSFVYLDSTDQFELGEEVVVTFRQVPFNVGTISTPAVIMRVTTEPKGYGLFFLNMNPRLRRQIVKYVISTLQSSSSAKVKSA